MNRAATNSADPRQWLLETLPPELRGTVVTAAELQRRRSVRLERTVLPTGVPGLDAVLGGGLPRGTLLELTGRGSSGRLAASLAVLSVVTSAGETAALVDRGGSLDPNNARELGVDLERLLWARPDRLPDAVTAADEIIGAGLPLVVIDAGLPPLPGRVPPAAWLRLARRAAKHGATVLVSAPYSLTGPAAPVMLRATGGRAVWRGRNLAPRVLAGLQSRLITERRRGARPHTTAEQQWTTADASRTDTAALPAVAEREETAHVAG